jgi:uncharacterized membrane protein
VAIAFTLGFHHWLRASLAVVFLMAMPGLPLARMLNLNDRSALLALAIALSLSIDIAVSMMMLWSDSWSPARGCASVVAATLVGTGLRLLQLRHQGQL